LQIFAPDGLCIFVNRAFLEMLGNSDADVFVGKYNYNNDPVCRELLGQDVYDRVSRGETVSFPDFPVPIQDAYERGVIDEKPFEAATMDLLFLPLLDAGTIVCTIMFYTVKNMYHGRADVIKAQEYIKEHWQDEFDLEIIARFVNISSRHFRRIFNEVAGCSPLEYYQNIKIENLREKLLVSGTSIELAFEACGVDSRGTYFRLFKEKVGMTPTQYRKKNNIK